MSWGRWVAEVQEFIVSALKVPKSVKEIHMGMSQLATDEAALRVILADVQTTVNSTATTVQTIATGIQTVSVDIDTLVTALSQSWLGLPADLLASAQAIQTQVKSLADATSQQATALQAVEVKAVLPTPPPPPPPPPAIATTPVGQVVGTSAPPPATEQH